MDINNPFGSGNRSGKEHRSNPERYFHVMGQGWFILTREGVNGPYNNRRDAELVVRALCGSSRTSAVAESSWRYKPV